MAFPVSYGMKTVIANWKMNPQTLEEAQELFRAEMAEASKYSSIKTIICPPFVYLEELAKMSMDGLGAQDIFWKESGPFTGEISTEMLKNFGVSHVLVGHSDRRYVVGETDKMINKKVKAALEADIVPILLVGEKERGDDRRAVLEKQLMADLDGLPVEQATQVLITYEPVWAISTIPGAEPDIPENALEAIKIIKNFLTANYQLRAANFLYGGSVTKKNVADFLKHPEISGAVIGGASLRKDEFANILKIVAPL